MEDLTKKQAGFVADYIDTGNASLAAKNNYNVTTDGSARAVGSENLTKPNIIKAIEDAAEGAFSRIVDLSITAENETVKLNANKDIVDRAGYKPIERTDIQSGGKPIPIFGHVHPDTSNKKDNQTQEEN